MDKSVLDMEIDKAKDLIYEIKKEFDDNEDFNHYIEITEYDAKWDENLNLEMLMLEYTNEMEKIKHSSLDYFVNVHREYLCDEKQGGLCNFTYGDDSLKEVMKNDILKALKIEFPEKFDVNVCKKIKLEINYRSEKGIIDFYIGRMGKVY